MHRWSEEGRNRGITRGHVRGMERGEDHSEVQRCLPSRGSHATELVQQWCGESDVIAFGIDVLCACVFHVAPFIICQLSRKYF